MSSRTVDKRCSTADDTTSLITAEVIPHEKGVRLANTQETSDVNNKYIYLLPREKKKKTEKNSMTCCSRDEECSVYNTRYKA